MLDLDIELLCLLVLTLGSFLWKTKALGAMLDLLEESTPEISPETPPDDDLLE